MLQEGGLIQRVTARELLVFVASTYPSPLPVDRALSMANLAGHAGRRVDRLSGGQAQRVRFAMAMMGDPDLVVLDEPTAALDVESRREFWASLRQYARGGRTVLFSTHHLEEADDEADRIVVIARGRVVADGPGEEIKKRVGVTTVSVADHGRDLTGLPGVVGVEYGGRRAHLKSRDPDATVLALSRARALRDLTVAPVGLEDAFLELTR